MILMQPRGVAEATAAAHCELGQYRYREGRTQDAVRHVREAHRLQPDNWTYKRQAWSLADPEQVPSVTKLIANHPDFLAGFVAMAPGLYKYNSLAPRLRELAVLRASQLNQCHDGVPTQLALGSSVGLSDEELAWLNAWSEAPASVFAEVDRLVLRYADGLTREVTVDDALWAALAARFPTKELFELYFSVGLAALVNRVHATFHTDSTRTPGGG